MAREVVRRVRVLAALVYDLSLVPGTYVAANYDCLLLQFQGTQPFHLASVGASRMLHLII